MKFTAIREPQLGHMIWPNKFSNSSDFLRFGAVITCRPPNREMHGSSLTRAPTRTPRWLSWKHNRSILVALFLVYEFGFWRYPGTGFRHRPPYGIQSIRHSATNAGFSRCKVKNAALSTRYESISHTPFCCVPPHRIYHWLTHPAYGILEISGFPDLILFSFFRPYLTTHHGIRTSIHLSTHRDNARMIVPEFTPLEYAITPPSSRPCPLDHWEA